MNHMKFATNERHPEIPEINDLSTSFNAGALQPLQKRIALLNQNS